MSFLVAKTATKIKASKKKITNPKGNKLTAQMRVLSNIHINIKITAMMDISAVSFPNPGISTKEIKREQTQKLTSMEITGKTCINRFASRMLRRSQKKK